MEFFFAKVKTLITSTLTQQELEQMKTTHSNDTSIDKQKDIIEFKLVNLCLERNIPYLGGGTLYQDIDTQISKNVCHMNYDDYDGHRHPIKVVENTPLHAWFMDSIGEEMEIRVSSYHHQGPRSLAERFVAMAFAPDGLIEGFYDPDFYNPEEGKFLVGLQFHPERMKQPQSQDFDYPGCVAVYQEFVKAAKAYKKNAIKNTMYYPSNEAQLVLHNFLSSVNLQVASED